MVPLIHPVATAPSDPDIRPAATRMLLVASLSSLYLALGFAQSPPDLAAPSWLPAVLVSCQSGVFAVLAGICHFSCPKRNPFRPVRLGSGGQQ